MALDDITKPGECIWQNMQIISLKLQVKNTILNTESGNIEYWMVIWNVENFNTEYRIEKLNVENCNTEYREW